MDITLPAHLSKEYCVENHIDLISTLKTAQGELSIDGHQVERIGTAGIQVLLAVVQYCHEHNVHCQFKSPSSNFKKAIELLGCNEFFAQWGINL